MRDPAPRGIVARRAGSSRGGWPLYIGPRVGADLVFARNQPVRTASCSSFYRADCWPRIVIRLSSLRRLVRSRTDLEATDTYTLSSWPGIASECLRVLEPQWSTNLTSPGARGARSPVRAKRHRRVVNRRRSWIRQFSPSRRRCRDDANAMESPRSARVCGDRRPCQSPSMVTADEGVSNAFPCRSVRSSHRASIFGNKGAGLPPVVGAVTLSSAGNAEWQHRHSSPDPTRVDPRN